MNRLLKNTQTIMTCFAFFGLVGTQFNSGFAAEKPASTVACAEQKESSYALYEMNRLAEEGYMALPFFQIIPDPKSLTNYDEQVVGFLYVKLSFDKGNLYTAIGSVFLCGNTTPSMFYYLENDEDNNLGSWISKAKKEVTILQDEGILKMQVQKAKHPSPSAEASEESSLVKIDFKTYDLTLDDGTENYDLMFSGEGSMYLYVPNFFSDLIKAK